MVKSAPMTQLPNNSLKLIKLKQTLNNNVRNQLTVVSEENEGSVTPSHSDFGLGKGATTGNSSNNTMFSNYKMLKQDIAEHMESE